MKLVTFFASIAISFTAFAPRLAAQPATTAAPKETIKREVLIHTLRKPKP